MPKTQPFHVEVLQVAPGAAAWKWKCLECGEDSGIWYRYEERAEEIGTDHVHESHGPRVIIKTTPFLVEV